MLKTKWLTSQSIRLFCQMHWKGKHMKLMAKAQIRSDKETKKRPEVVKSAATITFIHKCDMYSIKLYECIALS